MHPFPGFYRGSHGMLMTVHILFNHFIAAREEVPICILTHIYIKWIILQIFDVLSKWDGEQDWCRGKASPAHESAWLVFLVQSVISLGWAAEVESGRICSAQVHKAVVPLHHPAGRAQSPDCQRWSFNHHTAQLQLWLGGFGSPSCPGKRSLKWIFILPFFSSSKLTGCFKCVVRFDFSCHQS